MDIRLICMDLDGTALLDDHHSFSPRLHTALEKAHAKGIAIVPITGRPFALLPPPLKTHPIWESLVVLCNGSQIRSLKTAEIRSQLQIPKTALRQLLELAETFGLPIEFCTESTLYLTGKSLEAQKKDPDLVFHRDTILKNNGKVVDSLLPFCGDTEEKIEKVDLLCISQELQESVLRALKSISVSAVWSSSRAMEITHQDANKGNALDALCTILNISREHVLALGDSGNDLTMLQNAGLGIAMGNAPDFVKAAADAVTESNMCDGAALAIETYAL